jgi:hypothetical protein
MIAIVSSIGRLLAGSNAPGQIRRTYSNACATDEPSPLGILARGIILLFVVIACGARVCSAQAHPEEERSIPLRADASAAQPGNDTAGKVGLFISGAAIAFGAHEGGHLLFDVVFDARPGIGRVDFHGVPFFAVTHRSDLSPRREFTVSSAGFWVQHATDEWLLTKRPGLRGERAPLAKGVLAFNILTSVAYSGAAFARTGPVERDTRGIADALGVNERWIGLLILAPAALDAWRYFRPDARAPVWLSRGVKAGAVLLIWK